MAERRMFAKSIVDSDAFLDMPMSARLLYYDLGMRADDDGFINAPKKIMRMTGASQDDFNILIVRKFIIPFDSGVVVIKAWRINNYLRADRYNETKYTEEKSLLDIEKNGMYHIKDSVGIPCGIPLVDTDKVSIDKNSIDNTNGDFSNAPSDDEIFENLWRLYPKKKGKGQVSKTQKHKITKIGLDEMTRAIERFKQAMQGKDEKYIMYGSTFFNSGYVDYLDENYEAEDTTDNKVGFERWANE